MIDSLFFFRETDLQLLAAEPILAQTLAVIWWSSGDLHLNH
jgi:hypothetical protein